MAKGNVDKELAKELAAARNQPRYFAIFTKGAKVQKLEVSRKSIKKIAAKKSAAKADGVHEGVCHCLEGAEMIFELLGEELPGKEQVLKAHISEASGLKIVPVYRLVTELTRVPGSEGEDQEQASEPAAESDAPAPTDAAATSDAFPADAGSESLGEEPGETPSTDPAIEELQAALAKVIPVVQARLKNTPDRKAALLALLAAVKEALARGDAKVGRAALVDLTGALKARPAQPAASSDVAAAAPPAPVAPIKPKDAKPVDPESTRYKARMAQLMTTGKALLSAKDDRASEASGLLQQAGKLAKAGSFADAHEVLDRFEQKIEEAREAGPSQAAPPAAAEQALAATAKRAREIWVAAKESVDVKLSALQLGLRGYDDPDFHLLADKGLNGYTEKLQVRLMAALLDLERAPPADAPERRQHALEIVGQYAEFVKSDKAIDALEELGADDEIKVDLKLRDNLGRALSEMRSSLRGA